MGDIKNLWNKFVAEHGPKSGAFLQSFEWGMFQESLGRKVYHFVLTDNGFMRIDANMKANLHAIVGAAQVIKMPLPAGKSYLYIPRGPIMENLESEIWNLKLWKDLKNLAKQTGSIFIKLEPSLENNIPIKPLDSKLQILNSKNVQPKDTLILNLSKSEEELLAAMHEKTRYNIRLAEKKGVQIRRSTPETLKKDLNSFWQLAEKTAERDKFNYHPKNYYKKMLMVENLESGIWNLEKKNLYIKLVLAEKNSETLATNIIVFFGDTVAYLHGTSNYEHRELMASHLLQWRTIQEAKKLGYKYYDFWGIAPTSELGIRNYEIGEPKTHPWAGITRFKLGFGGEQISYAQTIDLPISKIWYNLYKIVKKLL